MLRGRSSATFAVAAAQVTWQWRHNLLAAVTRFARTKPLGAVGGIIFLAMLLVALIGPFLTPLDPQDIHADNRYASPGDQIEETGERLWLGSDHLGRDTLSWLILGARVSLYVALVSVGIGVTLGALLGIVSAYFGGLLDLVGQRLVDALMAFPSIILALAIVAVAGSSVRNVILALIIILIPAAARIIRSQALTVKEMDYMLAGRALGASNWRLIFRHMMPNCMAPYIVFATANLGFAIVVESGLSFLGAGSPPDVPSWGTMLSVAGGKYVEVSPWLIVFPSVAISIAVFGFNLLGDALRDVLDPRLRGAK